MEKSIVWRRPDGGVSITPISPQAVEQMEWASANVALLDQRTDLLVEKSALGNSIAYLQERVPVVTKEWERAEAERKQVADAIKAGTEIQPSVLEALERAANAISDTLADLDGRLQGDIARRDDVAELLITSDQVLWVKENIGLDEDGHELVLKAKSPEIADYVCVGHNLPIPADRTFRNAWENNGGVKVNMPKARDIHCRKMRAARVLKFAVLDVEFMRELENGSAKVKAAIMAQKQALRDVTELPEIEAATTPEELKAIWPTILD